MYRRPPLDNPPKYIHIILTHVLMLHMLTKVYFKVRLWKKKIFYFINLFGKITKLRGQTIRKKKSFGNSRWGLLFYNLKHRPLCKWHLVTFSSHLFTYLYIFIFVSFVQNRFYIYVCAYRIERCMYNNKKKKKKGRDNLSH